MHLVKYHPGGTANKKLSNAHAQMDVIQRSYTLIRQAPKTEIAQEELSDLVCMQSFRG